MGETDQPAELRRRLWSDLTPPVDVDAALYHAAVLEQYKMYVEMADRVSHRRGLANAFFLSLNTGVFTVVGLFWQNRPVGQLWWLVFPLIALLGQCFAWYYILRSYRLLSTAKYQVVGALEERLPSSPYWKAEWWALGEGKDRRRYWPLSHIEQWIPILFAAIYVAGFLAVMSARPPSA